MVLLICLRAAVVVAFVRVRGAIEHDRSAACCPRLHTLSHTHVSPLRWYAIVMIQRCFFMQFTSGARASRDSRQTAQLRLTKNYRDVSLANCAYIRCLCFNYNTTQTKTPRCDIPITRSRRPAPVR